MEAGSPRWCVNHTCGRDPRCDRSGYSVSRYASLLWLELVRAKAVPFQKAV